MLLHGQPIESSLIGGGNELKPPLHAIGAVPEQRCDHEPSFGSDTSPLQGT